MTARTVTVRRALAQAGTQGLAHLAAQQDTGTWISRCGRQIRGREIRAWDNDTAPAQAETLGTALCDDCRAEAIAVAGSLADGVAILLRLEATSGGTAQLLDVPLDALHVADEARDPGSELISSVVQNGVISPVIARRTPHGLELVSGTRRLAAARAAGLTTIPTVVRDLDADHATIGRLLENLHRENLDHIAQARAYQHALDQLGVTKQALADGLGLSRSQVSNTIRLLALPEHLKGHVAVGALTAEQARELLRCDSEQEQDALADLFLEGGGARRTSSPRRRSDPQLAELARALGAMLAAKVVVTSRGDVARVTIDVPEGELAQLLERVSGTAALAA